MTKRSFSDLVATWANIFKSIPAEQLEELRTVEDLWNEPDGQFKNPTRSEIKTGRPQEASGGGAERMVREYSDPAPQMGMAEKYAEFSGMLRDFGKSLTDASSLAKTHSAQIAALAQLVGKSAQTPAAKSADPDSMLAKAEGKLKKARAELRKAEMSDDEDKDEREEKKSFLEQAATALKSAKRLLTKAEDEEMTDEDEERAEKARRDWHKLSKAVRKAEDESTKREEDEEREMEKARAAAAATAVAKKSEEAGEHEKEKTEEARKLAERAAEAAKKAEHGGEATEHEDDEKAEKARQAADAAKKAVEAEGAKKAATAPVDASVREQLTVMSTTLKGLMDVVMGGSRTGPMPAFAKAAPLAALTSTVHEAIENGALNDPVEIMKAQTLVTHIRAVQEGRMDSVIVDDEIAKAPENVRQLFTPTRAAA